MSETPSESVAEEEANPYGYDLPSDRVKVQDLNDGDVIPSHDGKRHEVISVTEKDEGTVFVVKFQRGSAKDVYETEFPADHEIQVLKSPPA